jgi:Protein of unknown function (DUF3455)
MVRFPFAAQRQRCTRRDCTDRPTSTQFLASLCCAAGLALSACSTAPSSSATPSQADGYGSYAPAAAAPATAPAVPAALQAAPGERKALEHHARGVQIYRCDAASAGAAPAWAFVAPQAELFSNAASNAVLGTHGAGPFWLADDGSKVIGTVKARADATQAGAIAWLLLATTSQGSAGVLAAVTSIQRLQTVGGAAPANGCAAPSDLGKEARVPYTAQYVYYVRG